MNARVHVYTHITNTPHIHTYIQDKYNRKILSVEQLREEAYHIHRETIPIKFSFVSLFNLCGKRIPIGE